jgi:hypothetical protein
MKRRAFLHRLTGLALGGAAFVPILNRPAQAALSATRDAFGWIAVIGRQGETIIRISPRFIVEHPVEALHLMTTGRLP